MYKIRSKVVQRKAERLPKKKFNTQDVLPTEEIKVEDRAKREAKNKKRTDNRRRRATEALAPIVTEIVKDAPVAFETLLVKYNISKNRMPILRSLLVEKEYPIL